MKERVYVIKAVRVNGERCATEDDLTRLADAVLVRVECEKAWNFWKGRREEEVGPYTLQLSALKTIGESLDDALSLEQLMESCRDSLRQFQGIEMPVWSDENQVTRMLYASKLALAIINKQEVSREIKEAADVISSCAIQEEAHPVSENLLDAIKRRDTDSYRSCLHQIERLAEEKQKLERVQGETEKLRSVAPCLVESLLETHADSHWDNRISCMEHAWQWAQARYWLEEYINKEDAPALNKRVKQVENEINQIIAELASLHGWSFCVERLKDSHRRHMEAWQQSMRRLGKGTGKHAPRHRREAQQHLNQCREAVPAWVMPLHRVWDTVNPEPGMFDVIIVDEASQCGLEALPLFYLGKKVLIVGDDKQISPDAVGLNRNTVHRLMEDYIGDFQYRSSFDAESSLFDHGKLRYGTQRVTLREHFRCMPKIIRFSNDLCYSYTPLIPLRQYGRERIPPLQHVFVPEGYREGSASRAVNRPEAEALIARLKEMCGDERYDGKTMGIVVLQGNAQASLIQDKLLAELGAEEMESRRLVCANPYSFQGDERDIMFLSMVAASNERIGPLTRAADERRFNVATSRARDMMMLFHSVTRDDLSNHDLRLRLLEFFENTTTQTIAGIQHDDLELRASSDNRNVIDPPNPFDSWFEVDVALELLRKKYKVVPQYEFAGKRIDLVVDGGQSRLAIECDGDHWHGPDRYEEDMQRQRQLERCGWEFFRVRESAFYANRVDALSGLWATLEERGIMPDSQSSLTEDVEAESGDADSPEFSYSQTSKKATEESNSSPQTSNGLTPANAETVTSSVDQVTRSAIASTILKVLKKSPNNSCKLDSLTTRVLRELGIRTRGKPWKKFDRRVRSRVDHLQQKDMVEKYKAMNERVRLTEFCLNE